MDVFKYDFINFNLVLIIFYKLWKWMDFEDLEDFYKALIIR